MSINSNISTVTRDPEWYRHQLREHLTRAGQLIGRAFVRAEEEPRCREAVTQALTLLADGLEKNARDPIDVSAIKFNDPRAQMNIENLIDLCREDDERDPPLPKYFLDGAGEQGSKIDQVDITVMSSLLKEEVVGKVARILQQLAVLSAADHEPSSARDLRAAKRAKKREEEAEKAEFLKAAEVVERHQMSEAVVQHQKHLEFEESYGFPLQTLLQTLQHTPIEEDLDESLEFVNEYWIGQYPYIHEGKHAYNRFALFIRLWGPLHALDCLRCQEEPAMQQEILTNNEMFLALSLLYPEHLQDLLAVAAPEVAVSIRDNHELFIEVLEDIDPELRESVLSEATLRVQVEVFHKELIDSSPGVDIDKTIVEQLKAALSTQPDELQSRIKNNTALFMDLILERPEEIADILEEASRVVQRSIRGDERFIRKLLDADPKAIQEILQETNKVVQRNIRSDISLFEGLIYENPERINEFLTEADPVARSEIKNNLKFFTRLVTTYPERCHLILEGAVLRVKAIIEYRLRSATAEPKSLLAGQGSTEQGAL